jgi:hypothetical protein
MKNVSLVGLGLAVSLMAGSAQATLLWDGDAKKGTGVFGSLQPVNGTITIVDDPAMGKVFKIVCEDNANTKARSEVSRMAGVTLSNTGDYYIAWRSKWGPLPTKAGKWQVLSQIHLDGPGSMGGPVPFGLSVPGDGMMHFNAQDPTSKSTSMWDHALPLDSWHRYIVHTKMAEDLTGACEIWFDGVKQTLTNGKQTIPCAMAHPNSGSYWKWGVYRSGSGGPIGESVHYLAHPMMGTTLDDVMSDGLPGGGTGGTGGAGGAGGTGGRGDEVGDGGAGTGGAGGTSGTGGDSNTGGSDAATGSGGMGGGGGSVGSTGGRAGTGGQAGTGNQTGGSGGTDDGTGTPPVKMKGGAGCAMAGPASSAMASLLLGLALAVAIRARRRR